MLIEADWQRCDDGVERPVVRARVGGDVRDQFLIDTGADFTVLAASSMARLSLPHDELPAGSAIAGVGGNAEAVLVKTVLEFAGVRGRTVRFHCEIAGFTDPRASDMSILGRDVLDHFDVIVSRRTEQVLLLFAGSRFEIHDA